MAPKPQQQQCARYQYVVTSSGPKIVPVPDLESRDEESAVEYNSGGYLPVKLHDTFKNGRYIVLRKLGCVTLLNSSVIARVTVSHFIFSSLHYSWGHFSTVWLVKDTEYVYISTFHPNFSLFCSLLFALSDTIVTPPSKS